uniref:Putative plant transposon protein domain-containing protein n=1 Tax=Solanum tuberosum TaxID=4113 RepID=M1DAV3_SOLTU
MVREFYAATLKNALLQQAKELDHPPLYPHKYGTSPLCATMANNHLTLERAVMIARLMAGHEFNIAQVIIAEIHEREFRKTTTLLFPFLIFMLCTEATVLVYHIDQYIEVTKTVDVDLIRDEANPVITVKSLAKTN